MALPKLETPVYETVIPSTGQTIEYRPFLVKEEKILMMAQESKDSAQALQALKKIISSCTFGKVDPNTLTTYDAEYIFLQLRIKSVGETTEFQIKDEETGTPVSVTVDLTEVEVSGPETPPESHIKLNDSIGMTLKEVTLKDAIGLTGADLNDVTTLVASVVDTIYDEDTVYKKENISKDELSAFIESMNHKQLELIQNFIQNQPNISKEVTFTGPTGHVNTITLRGLQDFFA